MDDSTLNEFSRDFLAVLAGVLTAIAVALLLLPVVNLVSDSHFQIAGFSQSLMDAWKDDLLVRISLFAWLFLASIAGGLICTLIAVNRDIVLVLISSMVSIALVFIVSRGEVINRNHLIISVLIILGIPVGNVVGATAGARLKRMRESQ